MAHPIVRPVVDRLDKAADAALGVLDAEMTNDTQIKAQATRVRACNAVTQASSANIRVRLAAPKLAEIEGAAAA